MRYFVVFLLLVSMSGHADLNTFECVIKSSQAITNQGILAEKPKYKDFLDKAFNVDKNTGALTGIFKTDGINTQPSIIDYGSPNQAFKVLIPYYPETTVDFLLIESYLEGQQKPFTFFTLGAIFTGLCVDD